MAASCHGRKLASVGYPFEKLKFAKGHRLPQFEQAQKIFLQTQNNLFLNILFIVGNSSGISLFSLLVSVIDVKVFYELNIFLFYCSFNLIQNKITALGDLGFILHFCIKHLSLSSCIWLLVTFAVVRRTKRLDKCRQRLVPCYLVLILQVSVASHFLREALFLPPDEVGFHCCIFSPPIFFLIFILSVARVTPSYLQFVHSFLLFFIFCMF